MPKTSTYQTRSSYDTTDTIQAYDSDGNIINIPHSVLETYLNTKYGRLASANAFDAAQRFNDDVSFYNDDGVLIMKYDATNMTFIWSGAVSSAEGYVRLNSNFPLYLSSSESDLHFGAPGSSTTFATKMAAKADLNGDDTEDFSTADLDSDSIECTDLIYAKSGTPTTPAETGLFVHEETDGNTIIPLGVFSGIYEMVFGSSQASSGYGIVYRRFIVDIQNSTISSAIGSITPAGVVFDVTTNTNGTGAYFLYIDVDDTVKLRTPLGAATSGINIKINPTYYTF